MNRPYPNPSLSPALAFDAAASSEALDLLDVWDISSYQAKLAASQSPEGAFLRWKIADGPDHLDYVKRMLQRAGVDIDVSHLQKPLPAPEDNAAPLYTELHTRVWANPIDIEVITLALKFDTKAPPTASELDTLKAGLSQYAEELDMLRAAASKPQCVFTRDWEHGDRLSFLEFDTMKDMAQLMRAGCHFLIAQKQYAETYSEITHLIHIAQHCANDPVLLTYEGATRINYAALGAIRELLIAVGPDAQWNPPAITLIRDQWPPLDLRQAMIGEMAIYHTGMEQVRRAVPAELNQFRGNTRLDPTRQPPQDYTDEERQFLNSIVDAAEADYLEDRFWLVRYADLPDAQRLNVFEVGNLYADIRNVAPLTLFGPNNSGGLTNSAEEAALYTAQRQTTAVGAAVLAYKAANGTFPDKLEDAVEHIPDDPFNGTSFGVNQPLSYKRQGEGFVVYSIGMNHTFDGGTPDIKFYPSQAYFRYPESLLPEGALPPSGN